MRPSRARLRLPAFAIAILLGAGAAAVWSLWLGPGAPFGARGEPGFVGSQAILPESGASAPGVAGLTEAAASKAAVGAPEVGSPAPDFEATDLGGRPFRLSELRGKVVLVNFWATWCPPCREEMPRIEAFYRRYRSQLEVVGVSVGETAEQVRAFLKQNPYSWRFVVDTDLSVTERYRVYGIPVSYFIDRSGIVRGYYMGAMSAEQLRAFARQAGVDVD